MIYIVLILILVGADQLSKYLIDSNMLEGETIPIINEFFHITYVKIEVLPLECFKEN